MFWYCLISVGIYCFLYFVSDRAVTTEDRFVKTFLLFLASFLWLPAIIVATVVGLFMMLGYAMEEIRFSVDWEYWKKQISSYGAKLK